jgi:hypothetical protein
LAPILDGVVQTCGQDFTLWPHCTAMNGVLVPDVVNDEYKKYKSICHRVDVPLKRRNFMTQQWQCRNNVAIIRPYSKDEP